MKVDLVFGCEIGCENWKFNIGFEEVLLHISKLQKLL